MGKYDYLIVGTGLFGAVMADRIREAGKTCLMLERRPHTGGNVYTEDIEGIPVHRYGPHIFHTNSREVWQYVNRFAEFNHYVNSPLANYRGEIYNLPFNMNTFYRLWGTRTPREARAVIEEQRVPCPEGEPRNLEEAALAMVGRDLYEKLIRGYTEKQWGRPCSALPPSIIRRLPLRFTYDNNYFNARYQGIPRGGYTPLIQGLLAGADLALGTDYLADKAGHDRLADRVVYTGPIDAYFGFRLGPLEYRSLRFETMVLDTENYQGNAVVNYTDRETPYTRIIEHRHFEGSGGRKTVITHEYSARWKSGDEPYYPIEDAPNRERYAAYRRLVDAEPGVLFGGRLGTYRYYDMDQVVGQALGCDLLF